ncbi:MAG: DMT family transporter [Rhodobacteraceae bacterium]|nr:DMT family transporter [Paracoccaceae bacterium]
MTSAAAPATASAARAAAARRAGILVALLGMLMFALNDVMGKWLVSTYSVGQILLLRSAAALAVLAPILWRSRARLWPLERPWLQVARAAASTCEVYAFYYAVISLPLADVMTYWLAGPIYVAALSPWLLGEHVGPWRWTAILIGFLGVVVALRPGAEAVTPAVIVSLVGSAMFAFMMVSARMLRGTADGALVFWQTAAALVGGVLTARVGWTTPGATDAVLLALLGVVAMLAHLCIARALRLADAATVAPLQYTLLIWAIVFGWLIFGDLPEAAILAGAGLITASGLVIWLRETRASRARRRTGSRAGA